MDAIRSSSRPSVLQNCVHPCDLYPQLQGRLPRWQICSSHIYSPLSASMAEDGERVDGLWRSWGRSSSIHKGIVKPLPWALKGRSHLLVYFAGADSMLELPTRKVVVL